VCCDCRCAANGRVTVCCDCRCAANGTVTVCCDCRCTVNGTVTVCCDCRCAVNGTVTVVVTVGVQEMRQRNCRPRSWPSYLPSVWGEIIIKYVNLIHSTTAVQNSYCYCVDVADGELFSGTALNG
jgi:hypothetical protein